MAEFLRIRAAREAGERNRGRPKRMPGTANTVTECAPDDDETGAPDADAIQEASDHASGPPRKMPRCGTCNKYRTAATGHRKPRIGGRSAGWYCPSIPGTFEEWLEARSSDTHGKS
ncbi:hypothetical protein Pmar_PMAR008656 [Perkinsus marinus ATCC 50983]|uniref:Uncharacterized protein n=1 Tax=Perkinsus marinus (strain ATCC 50983 / TXsc) TaxID=423536 RepID=C5LQ98_PERM5|nr:hypothetical protein Pmar_PMAR008656 [Perkinsus marinus ATCC 50983]EER01107.1 hypothetical protein Pmar_PMAR008656 [Perkinsus marinus ATCC 50983]|eukprot:XP_002768389.1 hypothetical protein Pmar_PMAR008656 [Perkinsus marinus ATCC 50983]